MFNNFKATVRKWAGLPFEDLWNVLSWLSRSKSTFETDNPNVLVGKACNERGEPVVYLTAEPIFLVGGYAIFPGTDPSEAGQAADAIDSALVHEAEKAGVQRVLVVLPDYAPTHPQERLLRVIERRLPQTITVSINGKVIEKKLIVSSTSAEWAN